MKRFAKASAIALLVVFCLSMVSSVAFGEANSRTDIFLRGLFRTPVKVGTPSDVAAIPSGTRAVYDEASLGIARQFDGGNSSYESPAVFARAVNNFGAADPYAYSGIFGVYGTAERPSTSGSLTEYLQGVKGSSTWNTTGANPDGDAAGVSGTAYKLGIGSLGYLSGVFGGATGGGGTTTVASGLVAFTSAYGAGATITNAYGVRALAHTEGGGGVITSSAGISVAEMAAATNNTNLLLGTDTIPSGNHNLYSTSTDPSYFEGPVRINSGVSYGVSTQTGSYTATTDDSTILVNAATATITLPAAASNTGRVYTIKKIAAGAGTITIDPNAAETIDGAATNTAISAQYSGRAIQSDGTGWHVIGAF